MKTLKTLATWNNIKLTHGDNLGLTVWHNGRLVGCHMTTRRAMELVNVLSGETVWAF